MCLICFALCTYHQEENIVSTIKSINPSRKCARRSAGWSRKNTIKTIDSFVFNSNFFEPPCKSKKMVEMRLKQWYNSSFTKLQVETVFFYHAKNG